MSAASQKWKEVDLNVTQCTTCGGASGASDHLQQLEPESVSPRKGQATESGATFEGQRLFTAPSSSDTLEEVRDLGDSSVKVSGSIKVKEQRSESFSKT